MIPEAAAPPEVLAGERPAAGDADGRDGFWSVLIGSVDALLRSYYGICEFTDDPDCVLRVGQSLAREPVSLSDGTEIRPGDPIGTLHLWNEQLPRYEAGGPELGWAAGMRRRLERSLCGLAEFIDDLPDWHEVRGFRAETVLSGRLGALQLARVSHRYGFERVPVAWTLSRQLHTLGECAVTWGLARAYNPAALARHQFFRDYHELWISRPVLTELFGRRRLAGRDRGTS